MLTSEVTQKLLDKVFYHDPLEVCAQSEEDRHSLKTNRIQFIALHDIYKEGFTADYLYYLTNICHNLDGVEMDHLRLYWCRTGRVILACSNYNCPPPAIFGMVHIKQIYHMEAGSYAISFDNSKALADFVRGLQYLDKAGQLERIVKKLK